MRRKTINRGVRVRKVSRSRASQQPKVLVFLLSGDALSFLITKLGCHKNQPSPHGFFLLPGPCSQSSFNRVRTFAALDEKTPALSSDLKD